jgi:hypothetical protein
MVDGTIQTLKKHDVKTLTEGIMDISKEIFYLFSVACSPESTREDVSRVAHRTSVEINRVRAHLDKNVKDRIKVQAELKDAVEVLFQRIEWPPTT